MLKNQPCAYCGRTDIIRTRGHVLSKNLYPDNMLTAKRITVAECKCCEKLWADAEPHFRNILLSIWNSESLPVDSRVDAMWRSFDLIDGPRRASDLLSLFPQNQIATKDRELICPANGESFNLILRRIVRGLAAKHGIGHAVPDKAVTCSDMRWPIPPAFEAEFKWHTIAPDFFRYAYVSGLEEPLHSFWLLQFSRHLLFFGAIKTYRSDA